MTHLLLLGALALAEEPAALGELRTVFDKVERFDAVELVWDEPVVRLEGAVTSVEARREAASLVADIEGVRFVDNRLALDEPPPQTGEPVAEDAAVRAHLAGIFAEIDDLEAVEVGVTAGVVSLSGTVVDSEAHDKAIALAERQEGVVYVEDRLETATALSSRLEPAAEQAWAAVQSLLARGPLLAVAALVVGLFWLLARLVGRADFLYRRLADRPLLKSTVGQLARTAVVLTGVIIALEILDATALVGAVVGTAGVFGLAVGFAFQDIVENYLAGLLLAVQQPFSKDDLIEVGDVEGVVVRLTTRNTLILTLDGNHVYVPNATVFKSTLTNFSRNPHRRFGFDVGIGVDEDLPSVIATGIDVLREMPGVTDEPAPQILISALGDSTVVITVYGWVDQREHAWRPVRTEAMRRVKEAFDEAGYDMPEPIYRVRMTQVEAVAKDKPARHTETTAVDIGAEQDDHLTRQAAVERGREEGEDLLAG